MSIKLRFEKGSLVTQVILKDEAIKPLLHIVTEFQSDEQPNPITKPSTTQLSSEATPPAPDAIFVRTWLKAHSPSEILLQIKWETFPEKILLLGAYSEAVLDLESWRSADIQARFEEAHAEGPTNFPRDIANAIKGAIIAAVTPRTYRVTKTGWNKLYDAISNPAWPARPKLETPHIFTTEGMPEL
jgi:hypothetical protein